MSICDDALSYAKKIGVDECESVFCSKKILTVRITDSEIAEIKGSFEQEIGIRLVHKKRISSLQSTILDPVKIVDDALKSSKNLTQREFWKSFPFDAQTQNVEKTNDPVLWSLDSNKAADIAQEMINSASHQKVTRISGSLNIVCEDYEIANTNQLQKHEEATYISGIINTDSEVGDVPVSGIGQANSRTLAEFNANSVGSEAAEMCTSSLNPQTCEPEKTSIIFDPIAVGELLYFVFGPNFFLKTYSETRSCFSEKIGTKIAVDGLDLCDDPHVPNGLGSKAFDDEGVPTTVTRFIEDGVFQQTYSDSYNAFKEGIVSSGNACRPGSPLGRSAEPIPIAAPHNLTISAGDTSRDELIRETKKGVLVSRLWYTYPVNPIKGDFSCTARSGIWSIENGEIKNPARSVRIIHNLPTLLQNITAIAGNLRTVLPWAAMPVTAPTIKCDGISINPIQ